MSFKDFFDFFFSSIGYFVRRSGTICANLVEAGEIISNLTSRASSVFFSLNDSPCRQYFFFFKRHPLSIKVV